MWFVLVQETKLVVNLCVAGLLLQTFFTPIALSLNTPTFINIPLNIALCVNTRQSNINIVHSFLLQKAFGRLRAQTKASQPTPRKYKQLRS